MLRNTSLSEVEESLALSLLQLKNSDDSSDSASSSPKRKSTPDVTSSPTPESPPFLPAIRYDPQSPEESLEGFSDEPSSDGFDPSDPSSLDEKNDNFYYKHYRPGETPIKGAWSKEETKIFILELKKKGNETWGAFSRRIPGRNGEQCNGYYRYLLKGGKIDPLPNTSKKRSKSGECASLKRTKKIHKISRTKTDRFFYDHCAPGESLKKGEWSTFEREWFVKCLLEKPPHESWATFSKRIPGRTGSQCCDLYRKRILHSGDIVMKDGLAVLTEKGKSIYATALSIFGKATTSQEAKDCLLRARSSLPMPTSSHMPSKMSTPMSSMMTRTLPAISSLTSMPQMQQQFMMTRTPYPVEGDYYLLQQRLSA
eukprot:TRINITY_DN13_c1_g1_i1.p1 TRINITY_DN13_c1_g1~~TRINITY_DN13_c1_g1_i1.p1  ORF type:complete len:369 (-),score=30.12 TRINITY_DN13_c1_g1_i1:89-1195(-)